MAGQITGSLRTQKGETMFADPEAATSNYGHPPQMLHGFQSVRHDLSSVHPLEESERNWKANQEKLNLRILERTQGSPAALKVMMERKIANKIERVPGLPSSKLSHGILSGDIYSIDCQDVLNDPEESDVMINHRLLFEKRMGLL